MARKGFINVDYDPDLKTVQQDFARLEAGLHDKHEVMLAAEAVARHDIQEMFDGEHDALGHNWQYWKRTPPKRSYAKRAEKLPNVGILNRSSDPDGLRAKATSSAAFVIEGNRLTYGANLPTWAGVHLHGGKRVFPDGYTIPQRSFYPYSPQGVKVVQRIFDEWAQHHITIMERTSKRGRTYVQVQTRVPTGRGAETRFGPSPL